MRKNSSGFIHIILILVVVIVVAVLLLGKNKLNSVVMVGSPVAKQITDTSNWKTYTDTTGGFSFRYPSTYSLDTNHVSPYLNRNITWIYDATSILSCRGECPIVTSKENKMINGIKAMKIKGWVGAVGGNIPQSYIEYEILVGAKYFDITLWELPISLSQQELNQYLPNHSPLPISFDEETTFDQILSTFKFTNQNNAYTCPGSDYVNCMPMLAPSGGYVPTPMCSSDYLTWAKTNCPGFKGAAY